MSDSIIKSESTSIANVEDDNALNIPTGYICTVDRDTRDGIITVANALSDAQSLADFGEKPFTLVDVITTPGVRNRTGEVCTNTYLVTKDDGILMSQSDGIKRSVQQIVGLFNGDFGDGLKVSVSSKQLKSGNTLKTLHFYTD